MSAGPVEASLDSSIPADAGADSSFEAANTLDAFEDGQAQDGSPGQKDKAIGHGSEIDAAAVGPHKTPSGAIHNGPFTISAPGSYSNVSFLKGLTIAADDVELFDCLITTDNATSSFNVRVLGSNVRIHHCEIDNQSKVYYAIENNGGRANARNVFSRNNIHHAGQGISSAFSHWDFSEISFTILSLLIHPRTRATNFGTPMASSAGGNTSRLLETRFWSQSPRPAPST